MTCLSENVFYKELKSRKGDRSKTYTTYVTQLPEHLGPVLKNIPNMFPLHPDHGEQHSLRILDYLGLLVPTKMMKSMSTLELLVLIFSAYFHDTGMALFHKKHADKNEIRKHHPEFAKEVIDSYFKEVMPALNDGDRIKSAITFVCQAHGFQLDELANNNDLYTVDTVDTFEIRYGILAFLIRIGDLLDLEAERVSNFRMKLYSDAFNAVEGDEEESKARETSKEHNERHLHVKNYKLSNNAIEVTVTAMNSAQYFIWDDWFKWLKGDIEKFNAIYASQGLFFPIPKTEIQKPDGAKYEVQSLRFEIDDKGSMLEILSNFIYTDEKDFVRELLQNAIDASLKPIYLDSAKKLNHSSPRSWGDEADTILVCYSASKKSLCVIDHGIGMGIDELRNDLFKISSSGKAECEKRKFKFPGIAQYGIGFISCLINAENIMVYTSRDKEHLIKVALEKARNYAMIETDKNTDEYTGTTVMLKLRHQFTSREMQDYVASTFCFPSVSILYVDVDGLQSVLKRQRKKKPYDLITLMQEKPYSIVPIVENSQTLYSMELSRLNDDYFKLKKLLRDLDAISLEYKENYLSINTDTGYEEYNTNITNYLASIADSKLKSKLEKMTITKALLRIQDADEIATIITEKLDKNSEMLMNQLAYVEKEIRKYTVPVVSIGKEMFNAQNTWKYMVVLINQDLQIEEILKYDEPVSLGDKTGLLLIKQEEKDYDLGIEYSAINGFLFSEGKVCNRIVRITPTYTEENSRRRVDSFSIGINGWKDNIEDDIQAYMDEKEENRYYMQDFYYGSSSYDDDDDSSLWENSSYGTLRFRNLYDEINIMNNEINKNLERDINYKGDIWDEDIHEERSIKAKLIDRNVQLILSASDLQNIIHFKDPALYLDGIAIPSRLNNLFPLGFFRIVCNCTADARMKLNVTRHESSELREDVDLWLKKTGYAIQKKLITNLTSVFNRFGLDIEYDEILWHEKADMEYFDRASRSLLLKIINKI